MKPEGMEAKEMTIGRIPIELGLEMEKAGGSSATHILTPRRMRAVGYVRQSFGEMSQTRTSPEGQKARIAACADDREWHLVHTYEDIGWVGGDQDTAGVFAR